TLETLPHERLSLHQWRCFRAMARELLASNPFVGAKWGAAGVRSVDDLADWDDFRRLPFTRKVELVEDQAAHPPFGTNLTYPLERYVRVHQTSGTSGQPIRWLETQESWEWWARCWGFVLRGAGVEPTDRVFFPFSFGLFIGFWAGFEGARALGALAIPGGGQDSATRLAWMQALGATVLVCTPSYALHLIEVARGRGQDSAKGCVRVTVHAGEPGASIPPVRAPGGRHPRPARRYAHRPRRERLSGGDRGCRPPLPRGRRVPDRGLPRRRARRGPGGGRARGHRRRASGPGGAPPGARHPPRGRGRAPAQPASLRAQGTPRRAARAARLSVRAAAGRPAAAANKGMLGAARLGYHARRATWRQAAAETRRRTRPRPPPRCRGSSTPPSPSSSATSGASRSTPTSTATRPRSRFSRSTTRSSASRSRRSAARS